MARKKTTPRPREETTAPDFHSRESLMATASLLRAGDALEIIRFWDRFTGRVSDRDFRRLLRMMLATHHLPKDADRERDILASGINELADLLAEKHANEVARTQ